MNSLITAVAVFILVLGIYFGQKKLNSKVDNGSEVLTPRVESEDISGNENIKLQESEITDDSASQVINSATLTPYPTASEELSKLNEFIYPGSTMVSSSVNFMKMQSQDSADSITDWYKQKIIDEGMNVKTFIVTKANDKVLNTLIGSNKEKEIKIEIVKNPRDSVSEMTVKATVR